MKRLLVVLLWVVFSAPTVGPSVNPPAVSVVQLLANPEKYDGQQISVIGFLRLEFDGDMLYLSSEDYQHSIPENGLWVERNPGIMHESEKLDSNYVLLVGVFKARPIGYARFAAGGITKVSSATLWSELKYPRARKFKDMKYKDLRNKNRD